MSGNSQYINLNQDYEKAISSYQVQLDQLLAKSVRIGWIRFVLFLIILFCLYQILTSENSMLFAIVSGILFILFLVLIKYHHQVKRKRDISEKLVQINQNEWNVLHQKQSQFSPGESFGINHRFAEDLDLFGPSSLFHYINRCSSFSGLQTLANSIKNPLLSNEKILRRQKAIKELSLRGGLRQNILAHGLLEKSLSTPESLSASFDARSSKKFNSIFWKIVLIGWPIIMISLTVYFILTKDPYPVSLGVLLGLLLVGAYSKQTQKNSNLVSGKSKTWKLYATLFDLVEQAQFETQEMQFIHGNLTSAASATKKLGKIAEAFDTRLNLVAFILLNAFFLYDIRVNNRFDAWIGKYAEDLQTWIRHIGRFEALSSLATFYHNHPDFILPDLNEEVNLTGKAVGHPLIFRTKRIYNDFKFGPGKNLCIITGSNMAGKSTFLRTLGINCILGQMGAPVCATEYKLKPLQIHSSIRVADNLQEETSYFYAELKKLQSILQDLEAGVPSLVLLDEVLKGTNSEDKLYGAKQLIKKLIKYDALIFLATHILSLGESENQFPDSIVNYCFESTIEDNELHFDYKLKRGIAQHKNATFLMEKMGII